MTAMRGLMGGFLLCGLALSGFAAQAAVPAAATLSPSNPLITYDAGPFYYRNTSSGAIVVETVCQNPVLPCDDFALTVDLPADYLAAHPDAVVTVEWLWPNPVEDYDYQILDSEGAVVISAGTASDPEHATIGARNGTYTLRGVPFFVAGGSYTATIKLVVPELAPIPPLAPGRPPEYVALQAPGTLGDGSGEPSIGYNPASKRAMFLAGTQTLRTTFPENLAQPLPEVCDPLWEDVSFAYTGVITADPILFTDQHTGRTFVSQMHIPVPVPPTAVGLNSIFAYSDDDGDSWVPGQIGPPEGGYDHQTVGAGPYPASVPLGTPANGGSAVYYCSQAGFTAFCARSDTGGLTFPTGFPIYDAVNDGFGGIHGHVRVAPDGQVYVPVKACGDQQCVTTSGDAGTTWEVRRVPGSTPGPSDPSVGIASDGSLYFCYINGDGHPHVAVSKDKGLNWADDYDIGASQQIVNSVFPEAISGDPDRAGCAFLGTTTGGNFQALDFPGVWYGFVATTYDAGKSWHTVNVTPDAPVQKQSGIWLGGGGAQQRNLLDFNEITLDEQGRILFGYADGCVGDCESGGPNSFAAKASIARQIGGRPMFAAFDPPEPGIARGACLAGERGSEAAHLRWRVPYSGGADITGYRIYRGTPVGNEQLIAEIGAKARYDDFDHDPAVEKYSYKITAINAQGEGLASNVIELPLAPPPVLESACTTPGVSLLDDAAGDSTGGVASTDILKLSLAEPTAEAGKPEQFVFTLKVGSLSTLPPATFWYVLVTTPDGATRYVGMDTQSGTANFGYGTYTAGTLTTFTEEGKLDPVSAYSPDGTIVLVIDKDKFGAPAVGEPLTAIEARTRQGVSAAPSRDSTGNTGYLVRGTALCGVNTAPLALLSASPASGAAPLLVSFTVSGSDADSVDSLASFNLDFGDGSAPLQQVFGPEGRSVVSHRYEKGDYQPKLTVTDSRGLVSLPVTTIVSATANGGGAGGASSEGRFGGALGGLLLLPLLLSSLLRRRRD